MKKGMLSRGKLLHPQFEPQVVEDPEHLPNPDLLHSAGLQLADGRAAHSEVMGDLPLARRNSEDI